MTALITALREATHTVHQALHVHSLLAPLQDDDITLDDYCWCLRAFHYAYATLPPAHSAFNLPDVPFLAWLAEDMRIHNIEAVALPPVTYPVVDSYSKYIGYLYVKQGSTLGGRAISKHLQKILGLVPQRTNHFFAGFGEETGERWKQFLHLLDDNRIASQETVQQATATFQHIAACCDETLKLKQQRSYSAS